MKENDYNEYTNSVFEKTWWLEATSGKHPLLYIKKDKNNKVIARCALPIGRSRRIVMPSFTQTCGIWMNIEEKSECKRKDLIKNTIFEMVNQLPRNKTVDIVLDSKNNYVLPFIWKGYVVKTTFSYRLNNIKNHGDFFDSFENNVRRHIRSAENRVKIVPSQDVNQLYDMVSKSFAIQGRKYPYKFSYVKELVDVAMKNDAGRILTAIDDNGNVHASAFFLYDEHTCYYLIGGADPQYRKSGAHTLVLYEGIKFAQTVSDNFDFEGSVIEGIEKFFRGFNPELICNYRVCKLSLIDEIKDLIKPHIKKILGYR